MAPENTLAAFRQSLAAVGAFEMDLSVLSSGEVLVLHDETLRRTAACADERLLDVPVAELAWTDLRDVYVGSWFGPRWSSERPPTLGMALRLLAEPAAAGPSSRWARPHCFAELKPPAEPETAVGAARGRSLLSAAEKAVRAECVGPEQLTWISYSRDLAVEMKRRMPGHTSLLIGWATTAAEAWGFARECCDASLDGVDLNADEGIVTPELVEWMRGRGKLVAVYVDHAPAQNDTARLWNAMADAGVYAFTSNLPPEIGAWAEQAAGGGRQ